MPDKITQEQRSSVMRSVKSKGNRSTELLLINYFKTKSIKGWRRNFKLSGHPDFVFPSKRVVVFADGCFWHGHSCKKLKPVNNRDYWTKKISTNKKRDRVINQTLKDKGWSVFRFWECKIKKEKYPTEFLSIFE